MVLYKVNDTVFLSEYDKGGHNRKEDDRFVFVLNVNGVYVSSDIFSRRWIEEHPDIGDTTREAALSYIDKVNTLIKKSKHIPLLYIRLFEELGLDTKPLWNAREEYMHRREEQKAEKQAQQEQQRKETEEKERERLEQQKRIFLDDGFIGAGDFLSLCTNEGLDIHIRTKGVFNKNVKRVKISGSIEYLCAKGKKPDLDGCFRVIGQYKKLISTND